MKILAVSDVELGLLYSAQVAKRFPDIDLIISCGDLPVYYLDYISSTLNIPLYFVLGNHQNNPVWRSDNILPRNPFTGTNLHRSCSVFNNRLLLAGVEGSLRYNKGKQQYTQDQMWQHVFSLVPQLFWNRVRYGRFLDIFVTHAAPWKIHDQEDLPHVGIKAFRWLNKVFRPMLHLHGHIHVYRSDTVVETMYYQTKIINVYGYREIEIPSEKLIR